MQVRHPNSFSMERLEGKDALSVLLDGLSHFQQPYWLSAGTLLGLEREGRFLPHDTDIDVAVRGGEAVQLSKDYIPIRFVDTDKPMQRAYLHRPTNIIFDIFHYYDIDDKIYNQQEKGSIYRTKSLVEPLVEKEYLGHTFSVPNDIDKYLTEWYGDWRTPVIGGKTEWQK